jgi:hypothetical protein
VRRDWKLFVKKFSPGLDVVVVVARALKHADRVKKRRKDKEEQYRPNHTANRGAKWVDCSLGWGVPSDNRVLVVVLDKSMSVRDQWASR